MLSVRGALIVVVCGVDVLFVVVLYVSLIAMCCCCALCDLSCSLVVFVVTRL